MSASDQRVSEKEETTKPEATENTAQPASQPQLESDTNQQQQFLDLERWNALKQQQAQRRIIEHLMYSGKPEDEKESARTRMQHKVKQKQSPNEGKGGKKNKKKSSEFDVEKTLRSVLGSDYKPATNSKKRKKKNKRRKKQNQKQQTTAAPPPEEKRVKTEQERLFRTASNPHTSHLVVDLTKEKAKCTVTGNLNRPGFQVPELQLSLEASSIDSGSRHVFISRITKENLFGLSYQSEDCLNICCAEKHYESLNAYLDAWTVLTEEPETEEKEEGMAEANPEDAEIEEEEGDENDEEEGYAIVEFSEVNNYMYFENDLKLHVSVHNISAGEEDALSYCFSNEANPADYGVLTYLPCSSLSFLKKNTQILNTAAVLVNCNYLVKPETMGSDELSWSQIQNLILEHNDTTFILHSFDKSIPNSRIYQHFTNLVIAEGMDLANVVLFLPPPLTENQI